MEQVTANFTTATNCVAFQITANILDEFLAKARKEGRDYAWSPLDGDYWLPEKTDFNYEIACPNFLVGQTKSMNGVVLEVEVVAVFEVYQGYQNFGFSFAKVFQVKGEPNLSELVDISRMYAYLRFCSRDDYRDMDRHWWSDFLSKNVVSNETVIIFKEDKDVARNWAQRTFPENPLNAWIGKCGEFVFASWAGECGLSVSRVDLKRHPEGDEFDFAHHTLLATHSGNNSLKLDVKTFQIESDKKRNWWNVAINCLQGEHHQDFIIFVIIDEDFRMGKVVGFLPPDQILENCEYVANNSSEGYYRVKLNQIFNPYYLRATLDSQQQFFEGLFFGASPHEVLPEIVKQYPMDPITAYKNDYDWQVARPGGKMNLMANPSLKMYVKHWA